jgi:NTE family protein
MIVDACSSVVQGREAAFGPYQRTGLDVGDRPTGPTVGVALSGGGAAAFAHLGVLEALLEAEIPIRCVAGTSAGALIGAAFASGRLSQLRETIEALTWTRVLGLFDPTWPRAGLFAGERGLELIRPCLLDRLEDLPLPFAAVATDLYTGEEVVLDRGPTLEVVRASAALPGVFTPRMLGGRVLIDGGLVNPVPVSVARRLGADFVIAVSLYPVAIEGENRRAVVAHAPLPEQPRDMSLLDIVAQSSTLVQARIAAARLRDDVPEAVIVPPRRLVGLFEFHRARDAMNGGRQAGRDAVPAIRDALLGRCPSSSDDHPWPSQTRTIH